MFLEAEKRLKELEQQREKLDAELKTAREKMLASEESKNYLAPQLRVSLNQVTQTEFYKFNLFITFNF